MFRAAREWNLLLIEGATAEERGRTFQLISEIARS